MPLQELLSLALERIQIGRLPRAPLSPRYAGPGHQVSCGLCQAPITPDETEYQLAGRSSSETLYLHLQCYEAWQAARSDPGPEFYPYRESYVG